VSGGTAGCVLANRLSANPFIKVLLVERGLTNDHFFANCALLSHPPFGVVPAKGIKIVPQKALLGRDDTVYEASSLGGRTRINAGLYLPGCPAEYDSWGKGWRWEDVGPVFSRSEGRLELEGGKTSKQEGGEWKTRIIRAEYESTRQYVKPLTSTNGRFANAVARMGVPPLEAYDDPQFPTCFGVYQRRNLNALGRRCSTYHAFLSKSLVRQRKNLTIVLGAHVQRILFSNDSKKLRATGLLIEGKDPTKLFTVRARQEIIMCGGAIVSPQLLLLRYISLILN
jgi:choline dehydrogenase